MKFVTFSLLIFFFIISSFCIASTSYFLAGFRQISNDAGSKNDTIPTQKNSIGIDLVAIPAGYFYMGSHGKGILEWPLEGTPK